MCDFGSHTIKKPSDGMSFHMNSQLKSSFRRTIKVKKKIVKVKIRSKKSAFNNEVHSKTIVRGVSTNEKKLPHIAKNQFKSEDVHNSPEQVEEQKQSMKKKSQVVLNKKTVR